MAARVSNRVESLSPGRSRARQTATLLPNREAEVDKGIDGPYVAAVHFMFDSLDAMGAAMAVDGTADVLADVANYTSITPVLQTSEIVS